LLKIVVSGKNIISSKSRDSR